MTILITGATGMVGARLLPRLLEAGFDCRALMRNGRAMPAGVTATEADLFDAAVIARAVEGVEAIVHLAAVFRTQDDDLVWKTNLEGTRNLIAAAKAHAPDARFIMASTSNIYDIDAGRPGREDDPSSPQQAYPASKLAAEKELRDSGLDWTILRFSFVYGEGDGHIQSLPKMAAQASFHPAKRMSVIHHQDIATGVKLALTGALSGKVVNLADDGAPSMSSFTALPASRWRPRRSRCRTRGTSWSTTHWRAGSASTRRSGPSTRRRKRGDFEGCMANGSLGCVNLPAAGEAGRRSDRPWRECPCSGGVHHHPDDIGRLKQERGKLDILFADGG